MRLQVPLDRGAGAGALTALYKADEDAPWTALPADQLSRQGGRSASVNRLSTLCYFALATPVSAAA